MKDLHVKEPIPPTRRIHKVNYIFCENLLEPKNLKTFL